MAYDWKRTAKKTCIIAAQIVLAGAISYLTGRNEFMLIVPVLTAALDYVKHKDQ